MRKERNKNMSGWEGEVVHGKTRNKSYLYFHFLIWYIYFLAVILSTLASESLFGKWLAIAMGCQFVFFIWLKQHDVILPTANQRKVWQSAIYEDRHTYIQNLIILLLLIVYMLIVQSDTRINHLNRRTRMHSSRMLTDYCRQCPPLDASAGGLDRPPWRQTSPLPLPEADLWKQTSPGCRPLMEVDPTPAWTDKRFWKYYLPLRSVMIRLLIESSSIITDHRSKSSFISIDLI